jgi:hypothetical protein
MRLKAVDMLETLDRRGRYSPDFSSESDVGIRPAEQIAPISGEKVTQHL